LCIIDDKTTIILILEILITINLIAIREIIKIIFISILKFDFISTIIGMIFCHLKTKLIFVHEMFLDISIIHL